MAVDVTATLPPTLWIVVLAVPNTLEVFDWWIVAGELMALFKVLANENRLQLLHALERATELSVGELAEAVGMTMQAVSNQLQRLVDQGILVARRDRNYAYYRIVDPCVTGLLELGICLIEENRQPRDRRG